jgi:hypothetical protein
MMSLIASVKIQLATFAVGSGLIALGLAMPTNGLPLVATGGSLAAAGYAITIMDWKGKNPFKIPFGKFEKSPGQMSTPSTPGTPTIPQKPSEKIPSIRLPKTISDHKVPMSLIGVGLALVVSAIYFLLPSSPEYAVFTGLFIPGIVMLGLGVKQLYSRPPRVERYCMWDSFPMSPGDLVCGRCHKEQIVGGIDTRTCLKCEAINPAQALYCRNCGAPQQVS